MTFPEDIHPNLRINSYGYYLRRRFGQRISKVNVDAGFTCPNRDGAKGSGGCIYCNNSSFSPSGTIPNIPIEEQMRAGISYHKKRLGSEKFIIYFQKHTNTYGNLDMLRDVYTKALAYPDVIGISVGTRPDALGNDAIELLAELAKKHYVCLEIGLQSTDDSTLEKINRRHTLNDYIDAVKRCSGKGIELCTHLIYGFTGDKKEEFVKTAQLMGELSMNSVKLHQLHVVKGTRLEALYKAGKFTPVTIEEYIEAVADFLEHLPAGISIQRLYGSAPLEINISPNWGLKNNQMWYAIINEMIARNSWQGKQLNF
ncbi:MAG: TIGR01212 family radical SAM protein [Desulfuromonadales bacterium]|nr:TIGR01212 family radical SAM protein [Desulfuromonadales bacterium]